MLESSGLGRTSNTKNVMLQLWTSGHFFTLHCSYSTDTGLFPVDWHLHFSPPPAFLPSQPVSSRLQ